MYGLALEGGGAKGAFHFGALKALNDEGYQIGGVTGTSIGAINAAIIAQGDFEAGYSLWENMNNALLYDMEDTYYQRLINREIDRDTLINLAMQAKDIIDNRGVDTSRMRRMVESVVDEEKLRRSPTDFGLVTVSVTDLKPLELFKEDIPQGKLLDYIMASAHFPGLKVKTSDNKRYIDGGFFDNCPVGMLARKGYKQIFAIRTRGPGFTRRLRRPDVEVISVLPSENLGPVLDFDNKVIQKNLKMGYFDVLRVVRQLCGRLYYIYPESEREVFSRLLSLPEKELELLSGRYGASGADAYRLLFERLLPRAAMLLNLPLSASYQSILVGLLEQLAQEKGLERFCLYTFDELIAHTGGLEAAQNEPQSESDSVLQRAGALLKQRQLRELAVGMQRLLAATVGHTAQ